MGGTMDIQEEMKMMERGLVEMVSKEELFQKLKMSRREKKPLRVKLGLDPSAPDIHLGHTVVLQKLRQFQDLGHHVILIIGDFTGRIGDPSGRSKTRPALSQEQVEENARTYEEQFSKLLDPEKTQLCFNSSWLGKLSFPQVIQLSSRYTVARMLERDDFSTRYKENKAIGIHEFFYPLMQGYDSVAIEADIELGGTDQRFNLLVGRTLQKEYGQDPQIIMMLPLLEGLDGTQKMSKSLGNFVGIHEEPQDMYGKLMSLSDDLLLRYFQLLTQISLNELEDLKEGLATNRLHPKKVKEDLAIRIVSRYHSKEAALRAREEFQRIFREGGLPDEVEEFLLKAEDLKDGKIWIVHLLAKSGLVNSNSEARRLIKEGAVRLDGERVTDLDLDVLPQRGMILQIGKRRFASLKIQ